MFCYDLFVGVLSNILFVILLVIIFWIIGIIININRLNRAKTFFNSEDDSKVMIYISAFTSPSVVSRRVVNVVEFDIAIRLRDSLKQLSSKHKAFQVLLTIGEMIGRETKNIDSDIRFSETNPIINQLSENSIICIGEPISNQVSKYYMQNAYFIYSEVSKCYQHLEDGKYNDIKGGNISIIEKIIHGKQMILLIHGTNEYDTLKSVEYLIENWEKLYKDYSEKEFAVII